MALRLVWKSACCECPAGHKTAGLWNRERQRKTEEEREISERTEEEKEEREKQREGFM